MVTTMKTPSPEAGRSYLFEGILLKGGSHESFQHKLDKIYFKLKKVFNYIQICCKLIQMLRVLHNFLLKPEMLSNVVFAAPVEFLRYPAGPGNPVGQCPVLGGHFPGRSGTGSWQNI